jgi:GNAT superfamily N-acetyltransferase
MGTKAIPAYEIDNNLQARFESYLYLKDFDCGLVMMDEYYKSNLKRALKSENIRGIGAINPASEVIGFGTLTLGHIDRALAKAAIKKSNLPSQLSVVRVVMFGVDRRYQGLGIGQEILRHSFIQAVKVHNEVPIKGLYLDAAPNAVSYYESLGFQYLSGPDIRGGTPMLISIEPILQAIIDTAE